MTRGLVPSSFVEATRIEWMHNGNECVAEVGQSIRWRKAETVKRGKVVRAGLWNTGRTVRRITDETGPSWMVWLDPDERLDMWENPLLCGDRVTVT